MNGLKKIIWCIVIIYWGIPVALAQESVGSTGGTALGIGGIVDYSLGQTVYSYSSGLNGSIYQGVQQPYEFFTLGVNDNKLSAVMSVVYPNPSTSEVNLRVVNYSDYKLFLRLIDLNGNVLFTREIHSENTLIPMSHLAPGNYIIMLFNNSTEVKSFKIIKL